MTNSKFIQIIPDQNGREAIMVRVDKTLKEVMEEKPASRWDPDYWHPKYEEILSQVKNGIDLIPLINILKEEIIAPDHVRASKGEKIGSSFSYEYRTLKDLLFTGLNYASTNYCSDNAGERLQRTSLRVDDILFAGSGIGAIGRIGIVEKLSAKKSCVGDLFILRSPSVDPFYLHIYLLTVFGQSQIEKIFHGIQSAKISTKEILAIKITIVSDKIQKNIKSEYKKMSAYHDKAMEGKKKSDEAAYKKNIEVAEKMLKDLIVRTEAVIRGERKDVI